MVYLGCPSTNHQVVKYAIKIRSTVNHPARSVLQDSWTNHYGRYNKHTTPLFNKVNPFFKQHTYTCTHKQLPETSPWQLTQPQVDITLSNLISKKDNPVVNKQIASQHIDSLYSNYLQVFTDGSKTTDGKVSSAVSIPALDVNVNRPSHNIWRHNCVTIY